MLLYQYIFIYLICIWKRLGFNTYSIFSFFFFRNRINSILVDKLLFFIIIIIYLDTWCSKYRSVLKINIIFYITLSRGWVIRTTCMWLREHTYIGYRYNEKQQSGTYRTYSIHTDPTRVFSIYFIRNEYLFYFFLFSSGGARSRIIASGREKNYSKPRLSEKTKIVFSRRDFPKKKLPSYHFVMWSTNVCGALFSPPFVFS